MAVTRNINDDNTLAYLFRQITDGLKFRKGGKGAAIGKAAERDNELDIGNWKLTAGNLNVPLFKVVRFTRTSLPSIAAGQCVNISVDYTAPTGYTAIGVVGMGGSGNGSLAYCDFNIQGGDKATIWARNNSGSAVTPTHIRVDILFVLTEAISQKAW